MERWQWLVDTFTFIGMAVSILTALIAIVWLTCFIVKLLVKTFGVRVGKSYDLMVEDITKKTEAKRERKEQKRQAAFKQKNEILNMKLESKERIHEMKKQKLADTLEQKEKVKKTKLFGESIDFENKPKEKEIKKEEVKKTKDKDTQKVEKENEDIETVNE